MQVPKHGRSTKRDDPLILQMGDHTALGTSRTRRSTLDVQLQHGTTLVDAEHVHFGQTDEDLADAVGVLDDGWAQKPVALHAVRLAGLPNHIGDPIPPSDPKCRKSQRDSAFRLSERALGWLGRVPALTRPLAFWTAPVPSSVVDAALEARTPSAVLLAI